MGVRQHRSASARPRQAGFVLYVLVALLALAAAGGAIWWASQPAADEDANIIRHTVERSDFLLAVTERGEIESGGVTEVRSEVKTKNTAGLAILDIVPEGTKVEAGDFLVQLDSSALEEERTTQKIAVNNAQALVVEANNVYETAVIAEQEYLQGTYVQERQTIESEVFVAEENLNRAKEYLAYSTRLAAKGYVNDLQLQADKFAVEKSQKELDAAKTKLTVLDEFTKPKMLKQLQSDILIYKAKWEAEKNSLELELGKLQDIEDQIAKCTITSPKEGVVTYAHERQGFGNNSEFIVQEGAEVRERQVIIRLPDPSSMRVEITINESLVQYVAPGLPATVAPVGIKSKFRGEVVNVNQYAEPSGWRRANVKEYKAFVSIDNPGSELRSGMTAAVTIKCESIPDAVQAPVQAVFPHGPKMYCLIYNGGSWEARPVATGPTNDKYFVVKEGLEVGEQVAMNPRQYLDQVELPEIPPERPQQAPGEGPPGPPGGGPPVAAAAPAA
ncbi:MAG: efflux transporter periplasmic adaptor subunit [Planctomycetaceae bacterium]|nr:efflux transporter periplasmic adaptor subunit [Planctomycetaceae bacterium]